MVPHKNIILILNGNLGDIRCQKNEIPLSDMALYIFNFSNPVDL